MSFIITGPTLILIGLSNTCIDCLNPPEGGVLTYSNDFTNVATYQCNDGLQLTQLRFGRTCTATGWDKDALSCSKCMITTY